MELGQFASLLLVDRQTRQVFGKVDLPSFETSSSRRHTIPVRGTQQNKSRLEDPVDVRGLRDQRPSVQRDDQRTVSHARNAAVRIASRHHYLAAAQTH